MDSDCGAARNIHEFRRDISEMRAHREPDSEYSALNRGVARMYRSQARGLEVKTKVSAIQSYPSDDRAPGLEEAINVNLHKMSVLCFALHFTNRRNVNEKTEKNDRIEA